MTVYTVAQASQQLMALLDRVEREDEVCIRRTDGRLFVLKPVAKSPLDVEGVDLEISTQEIVQAVREMRERTGVPVEGEFQNAENETIVLNNEERDRFIALLDNPPPPNEALKATMLRHREHLQL